MFATFVSLISIMCLNYQNNLVVRDLFNMQKIVFLCGIVTLKVNFIARARCIFFYDRKKCVSARWRKKTIKSNLAKISELLSLSYYFYIGSTIKTQFFYPKPLTM